MKTLILFPLGLLRACANGFVLSRLWLWFVVPLFGLPAMPTLRAIGVMYVISFLSIGIHLEIAKAQPKKPDADPMRAIGESLAMTCLGCPLVLGIGYLWHLAIVAWS